MSALKSEILSRLSTARLPSLPHVLVRLMALCQSDNTTISDLASLIEQEPAMTHKILQVASSPAYHHMGEQTKLEQSLITLGTHLVRMIVINESVFQNFNDLPIFRDHDLRFFWLHSLKTAIIARKAAWHRGLSNIDEAYLAGLLHDIGRLGLLAVVPDLYRDLFYLPDTPALFEKEREMLGLDHAEAGASLIRQWKFDQEFIDSVSGHHTAGQSETLSQLVHMANRLAECSPDDPEIDAVARNYVFPSAIALQIVTEADRDVQEAASHLGIDIAGLDSAVMPEPATPPTPVQQQINQELSTLIQVSELGRYFHGFKTETELQDAALKAAAALFSLKSAVMVWQTEEMGQYRIIAVNQAIEQLKGHPLSAASSGWVTQTFAEKLPAFIATPADLTIVPEQNMAKLLGGEAWVLLPLARGNQCPGLIFASIPKEHLDELQQDKYRLIYFGQQFVSAWNHLQQVKQDIESKVALAEARHQRISREMAQEVNNPLAVIRNYLFVLNKQLDTSPRGKKVISILNEEIDRLAHLINEMGKPAYAEKARAERTDIKSLVQDVITLFNETGFIADNVQIITHASPALPEKMIVCAPQNLLNQVLVNLIKNAVEAMPKGGSIMITHKGLVEQQDKKYYALSIRDTGPGIPKDILDHLFQPAATAGKQAQQGLGLSIAYSLLNKIDAQVDCQTSASGTEFTLLLPAETAKQARP